jgi:hypothetical protein
MVVKCILSLASVACIIVYSYVLLYPFFLEQGVWEYIFFSTHLEVKKVPSNTWQVQSFLQHWEHYLIKEFHYGSYATTEQVKWYAWSTNQFLVSLSHWMSRSNDVLWNMCRLVELLAYIFHWTWLPIRFVCTQDAAARDMRGVINMSSRKTASLNGNYGHMSPSPIVTISN